MPEAIESIKQKALTSYNRKDYQAALEGFNYCLSYYTAASDELAASEMLNNISVTYLGLKDPQKAYEAAAGTDEVFTRHADRKRQGIALANTATALEQLNRKEEALALYEQVLEIFKEIGEKDMRITILRRVSDLQLKTKRQLQAIASMESAYDQKEKRSARESIFHTLLTSIRQKFIK